MNRLEKAAARLIANVMSKNNLKSINELACPDMRELAEALKPRREVKPRRGIGVHTNVDMFRGR